jgi:hypothetical protein
MKRYLTGAKLGGCCVQHLSFYPEVAMFAQAFGGDVHRTPGRCNKAQTKLAVARELAQVVFAVWSKRPPRADNRRPRAPATPPTPQGGKLM